MLASQNEEHICLLETALGEAEIGMELAKDDRRDDFGILFFPAMPLRLTDVSELARRHLRSALSRATRMGSRGLTDRLTSSLALLAEIGNDEEDKNEMTELWAKQRTGDTVRLADEREQIKQFGRMVRMVGLRVAEGWC